MPFEKVTELALGEKKKQNKPPPNICIVTLVFETRKKICVVPKNGERTEKCLSKGFYTWRSYVNHILELSEFRELHSRISNS